MRTDAGLILLIGLGLVFTFSSGAQPVITSQPTNQSAVDGGIATFAVVVSGTGPFTYRWLLNGTNLPSTNVITTVAGSGATTGNMSLSPFSNH